jgi:hypothetical protein
VNQALIDDRAQDKCREAAVGFGRCRGALLLPRLHSIPPTPVLILKA